MQGDADNKALDFVERDSGIKQEHDLNKQAMINQGQNEKEMIKQQGLLDSQANQHDYNVLSQLQQHDLNQQAMANEAQMQSILPPNAQQ
ncbi:hypothetical protein [Moraxella catarrhalis]|uniref:hypothetical protein n=1 Tax=Moraxella catarrhalis TaxID=480 RepID=UPI000202B07C|nr:hypothetical protein [Moraxella catarrhalis]EGE20583.1 hypothetical protein E9U_04133 [Moraxella catarrhalis BC8]